MRSCPCLAKSLLTEGFGVIGFKRFWRLRGSDSKQVAGFPHESIWDQVAAEAAEQPTKPTGAAKDGRKKR